VRRKPTTAASRIQTPPRHSPRCEAEVKDQTQRWRERSARDNRCDLVARFVVKGENLCGRHAGDAALAFLLKCEDFDA